jgi:hypothetical protein
LLVRLGDPEGDGILANDLTQVVYDETVDLFVAFNQTGNVLQIFDSAGRFVRRIERAGQGPGELGRIQRVEFQHGSLWVRDSGNNKWLVLDPAGRVLQETRDVMNVTGPLQFEVLAAGEVVVGAIDPRSETVGYPLHLIDLKNGEALKHFGSLTGEWNIYAPYALFVLISAGSERQTVWKAGRTRLRFEEWELDGTLKRVVEGNFAWSPAVTQLPRNGEAPVTYLRAFVVDADERLWSLTRTADERWREVTLTGPEGFLADEDSIRWTDSRLDMFDLRNQTRYGPYIWDESVVRLRRFGDDARVVIPEEDAAAGTIRAAVYRLRTGTNQR